MLSLVFVSIPKVTLWDMSILSNWHQLVKIPSFGVKITKIIFHLLLVDNLLIWHIKKYVFNWYLKMTTRASNGLSIEIKHKFVISLKMMMKRDGRKWNYFAQRSTSPIKALNPTIEIIIMVEIVRLRTKVYRPMNSCITFVYLGPYTLVCACVCNILSHTMNLFLWWRLENSLDIWLIPLVVMAWACLMLKLSSKWGMS
jgi:hypothetical protein